MNRLVLVSGASGGMIGAAYYRELYLKRQLGERLDLSDNKWLQNIAKDNLNPVIFSMVVNDTFFKLGRFRYRDQVYRKDRGYIFEKSLNANLDNIFSRTIGEYYDYEIAADIPMLLLSPTIANDGRKMYVSSMPLTFMNTGFLQHDEQEKILGIHMLDFFADHGAADIPILTALRMSASFPYITPNISLPSEPGIEIMDAGISDNFGVSDALKFIYHFKDWISENTGGVVILVIRDTRRIQETEKRPNPSIFGRFVAPISNVYNNLSGMQDLNNERQLLRARSWIDKPLNRVEIEYDGESLTKEDRASLSWHLTAREKKNILDAIHLESNQKALTELQTLILSGTNIALESDQETVQP